MNRFIKYQIWLLWTISMALGWSINEYSYHRGPLQTWAYVGVFACIFLVNGFLLGLFIGIFQFLFLRKQLNLSYSWILMSSGVHSVSIVMSFLLLMIMDWIAFGLPSLPEDASITLDMPLDLVMILSGAFIGLIQINYGFIGRLADNLRKKLLWILSTAFGWGMGCWVVMYSYSFGLNDLIQNILCGLTIGVITGGILLLLLNTSENKALNVGRAKFN